MTYCEFVRIVTGSDYLPMEVLDKLITAGVGNRKPRWQITESEFDAAMRIERIDLPKSMRVRQSDAVRNSPPRRKRRPQRAVGLWRTQRVIARAE